MSLIESSVIADAAFQMLASSTIKRYLRVAREIAGRAGLIEAMRTVPETANQALNRARTLWQTVSSADSRPPEEFELGLLLVGLSDGGYEPAESLLLQIASSPDTTPSWSIALAKRMCQLGPLLKDEREQFASDLAKTLASITPGRWGDDPRLRVEARA